MVYGTGRYRVDTWSEGGEAAKHAVILGPVQRGETNFDTHTRRIAGDQKCGHGPERCDPALGIWLMKSLGLQLHTLHLASTLRPSS